MVCGGQTLSYGELERRANRVARQLLERGIRPEKLVGICVSRSVEMVVGMLGIWKAGGAYVSARSGVPARASGVHDGGCGGGGRGDRRARRAHLEMPAGTAMLCLDEQESSSPVTVPVSSEHLAYMIYTSGSTGRPKGVEVTHGGLSMHCQAVADVYGVTAEDRALHFASLSFDAAVEQWAVPLMRGARLVIMDELWSAERAYEELIRHEITWLDVIPSYLAEVARWANGQGLTLPLRSCTVGGEAVTRESFERIQRMVKPASVLIGYGPTEAVVTPMVWPATAETQCETAYAPIGKPVGSGRATSWMRISTSCRSEWWESFTWAAWGSHVAITVVQA